MNLHWFKLQITLQKDFTSATDLMASSWTRTSSIGCWGAVRRVSRSLIAPRWNRTTGSPGVQWTLQISDETWNDWINGDSNETLKNLNKTWQHWHGLQVVMRSQFAPITKWAAFNIAGEKMLKVFNKLRLSNSVPHVYDWTMSKTCSHLQWLWRPYPRACLPLSKYG